MNRLESITIVRAGTPPVGFDSQGNPLVGADVAIVSAGWKVAPRSSNESAEPFGQQVITGRSLLRRTPEDIRATDRLIFHGETWAVDGDVADWHSGVVVNVKRVS